MRRIAAVGSALALLLAAIVTPLIAQETAMATVSIGDNFFAPDDIIVPAGTTVLWVNEGRSNRGHTVTSVDELFDTESLRMGDTFTFTFTEPGEYAYFCKNHDGQVGIVRVTAPMATQPAPEMVSPPAPSPASSPLVVASPTVPAPVAAVATATVGPFSNDEDESTSSSSRPVVSGSGGTSGGTGGIPVVPPSATPTATRAATATVVPTVTPTQYTNPRPPVNFSVSMENFYFSPSIVNLKVGDIVTFTNNAGGLHDAVGPGFSTGPLTKNQAAIVRFNQAGTFNYRCTFHPEMIGTVIVTQ